MSKHCLETSFNTRRLPTQDPRLSLRRWVNGKAFDGLTTLPKTRLLKLVYYCRSPRVASMQSLLRIDGPTAKEQSDRHTLRLSSFSSQ